MKKAQMIIFVVVGILIVSVIAIYFLLRSDVLSNLGGSGEFDQNGFLDSCMKDKIREGIDLILTNGGYTNSTFYVIHDYENIAYLCHTPYFYTACVNQEPVLMSHIEDEIKDYIDDDVEICWNKLTAELGDKGYVVDATYNGFEVNLFPKKVLVNVNANLVLTKTEETKKIENFEIIVYTELHDLATIVWGIIESESRFCYFDYQGFSLIYPRFYVDQFSRGDLTTIYSVSDKKTQEKFKFAIRGCVIPPGI